MSRTDLIRTPRGVSTPPRAGGRALEARVELPETPGRAARSAPREGRVYDAVLDDGLALQAVVFDAEPYRGDEARQLAIAAATYLAEGLRPARVEMKPGSLLRAQA
jgi:hypothetical protein